MFSKFQNRKNNLTSNFFFLNKQGVIEPIFMLRTVWCYSTYTLLNELFFKMHLYWVEWEGSHYGVTFLSSFKYLSFVIFDTVAYKDFAEVREESTMSMELQKRLEARFIPDCLWLRISAC